MDITFLLGFIAGVVFMCVIQVILAILRSLDVKTASQDPADWWKDGKSNED